MWGEDQGEWKMRKINLTLTMLMVAILLGCASFNTPFIDTDETTQLSFGMSTNEVLKSIGNPLFVESGGKGKVVWVYEIRNIEVQSKPDIIPVVQRGGPNKKHRNFKHGGADHRLALTFNAKKLESWGPILNEDE